MSMQAMASFLEKAQGDPVLAEELVSIIEENEREVIYTEVVSLAGRHGFEITVEDAAETRKQFEQTGDGDLSDDDLENVAGGIAPAVVAGLITGGAALGAAGIGAGGAVGAAGVGAAGAVTAATLSRGVNKTASDIGNFFKKW